MAQENAGSGLISVRIPAQIRRLYGAHAHEEVAAATIHELVAQLDARFPGMGERLMEPGGIMRRWVNLYVDGEDIRALAGEATPLPPGCEVMIVPSVAGGQP